MAVLTINFPINGILSINPTTHPEIQPGDTVQLRAPSIAKCLLVDDIVGALGNRINFTNYPGEQLILNNTGWVLADGFGVAWKFEQCKYFNFYGTGFLNEGIKSDGPTGTDRQQFFHFQGLNFTDNFSLYDFSTYNGGTGIQFKTFVTSNPLTWKENTTLHNIVLGGDLIPWAPAITSRLKLNNTGNEAVYGGHTAPYENYTTGIVWGPTNVSDPVPAPGTSVYKKPVHYENVKCKNVWVNGAAADGLQFAACDNLEICYNYVTDWANFNADGHKAGILVGGGCLLSSVHDNICMNATYGWGLWHFAEGPGHVVYNNLFYNHDGYMCFIKGGTHLVPDSDYHVTLTNNTFADNGPGTYASGWRISGIQGGTAAHTFNKNIMAQVGGKIWDGSTEFIALEQDGHISEGTGVNSNVKAETILELDLNLDYYLQPMLEPGGMVDGKGFRIAAAAPPVYNLLALVPAAGVAKQNVSFVSAGVNETNIIIIFEVGAPLKSYRPGRLINGITGFIYDKGYYIIPKANLDFTSILAPPI